MVFAIWLGATRRAARQPVPDWTKRWHKLAESAEAPDGLIVLLRDWPPGTDKEYFQWAIKDIAINEGT